MIFACGAMRRMLSTATSRLKPRTSATSTLVRRTRCCQMTASNQFCIVRLRLLQSGKVLARHDQHVHRRLRLDVLESEDVVVFVDFLGGDFSAQDAAEQAVRIGHLKLSREDSM